MDTRDDKEGESVRLLSTTEGGGRGSQLRQGYFLTPDLELDSALVHHK